VAVAGFSWGGIANLFAAAHDSRITALVALDGSMRYFPGLVKDGGVHPEQMTIPLLFFTQGEFTMEDQAQYLSGPINQGPSVLNAWTHGDLILVRMLAMIHTEYSSVYQRNENSWKDFANEEKADFGRDQGIPGFAWMARYTLDFLNAYLKHDPAAMAWLKKTSAENGAPPHFFTVKFRAGSGMPATFDNFKLEVGKRGFDHIKDVYADFHKQNPDFKLEESTVNIWGYSLLSSGNLAESIAVLELNAQLYPDSSNVYDSLGDAYAKAGKKDLAIENYRKAIEKDPNAAESKRKLEELEKAQPTTPAAK
jgi:tetratricopeptide (TPR) repeat protein